MNNISVRNYDILYAHGNIKIGGHSAFNIICDVPANIENIRSEDVPFECCTMAGEPFKGSIYSQLKTSKFVKNMKMIK